MSSVPDPLRYTPQFERATTPLLNRVGMVADPTYFPALFALEREREIAFWWKGRVPDNSPRHEGRLISQEQIQQEANEARKAKRALQKAKAV